MNRVTEQGDDECEYGIRYVDNVGNGDNCLLHLHNELVVIPNIFLRRCIGFSRW